MLRPRKIHPEIDVSNTKATDISDLEVVAISPSPSPPLLADQQPPKSRRRKAKKKKIKYRIVEGEIISEVEDMVEEEEERMPEERDAKSPVHEGGVERVVEPGSTSMEVVGEIGHDAEADADLFERFTDTSSSIHSEEKADRFPPLPPLETDSLGSLPGPLLLSSLHLSPFAPVLPSANLFDRRLAPPSTAVRTPSHAATIERTRGRLIPPVPGGPNSLRSGPSNPFIPLPSTLLASSAAAFESTDTLTPRPLGSSPSLPPHLSVASYPFLGPSIRPARDLSPVAQQQHGPDTLIDPNLLNPVPPLSDLPRPPQRYVASLPPLARPRPLGSVRPDSLLRSEQKENAPDDEDVES
ncbi:hypothetical protein JCM11491_005066 [Sporobolomyces phaffii]